MTIGNRTSSPDIPYSLVVGGSALWMEGQLNPPNSGMYVGGLLAAPAFLSSRRTGGPCANCGTQLFQSSRNYYNAMSSVFDAATPNADIQNAVVRCNSNTSNVNVLDMDYLTFIAQYYGGMRASNSSIPTLSLFSIFTLPMSPTQMFHSEEQVFQLQELFTMLLEPAL